MDNTTEVPTPDDLEDAGAALWQAVTETYDLDVSELALLAHCARLEDELARLRSALLAGDMIVSGSMGQPRPSPLLDEMRKHREVLGRLLKQLDLPQSDDDAGEDKPRWIAPDVAHERAKKAAAARWGKR